MESPHKGYGSGISSSKESDLVHQVHLEAVPPSEDPGVRKGMHFWLIFLGLCLAGFISAIDINIIFTALPTISDELGSAGDYTWLGNSYVLAVTSIQPLYGQLADIFGRRYPFIASIVIFALGSGVAGGSRTTAMFIAGRIVQGLGGGGMIMLIDLIVCDLLPLRDRSTYLGVVLGACAIGSVIGPVIGGAIVTHSTWRWAFWLNLPVCGITLAVVIPFFRVKVGKPVSWWNSLARLDFVGNFLFIASITSVLIGLVSGGTLSPWGSWRTILPLVLGFLGLGTFFMQQAYCDKPIMPLHLFTHRTSVTVYLQDFIISVNLQWCVYVLPLYFQSVQGTSALDAGINILPINAFMIPTGAVAGALLTRFGHYKPLHWAGFIVLSVSFALLSTLSESTTTVTWAWFEILAGIGIGLPLTTQLPAIQAVLPESDAAVSTSTYSFIRSFGFVWGATIPAVVFNSRVDTSLGMVDDLTVRNALAHGGAYEFAVKVRDLTGQTLQQTLHVYTSSLRIVWFVGFAISIAGFLLVFGEQHVDLRATLDTEYGLDSDDNQRT
ncbi:major facilitator superfamily domain-containing protein [Xylaria bambusicola]|uniref:major facilitator superfamily domain-containing protein n=1 Tax=Xylaria bambusicola TaxID=326684 RepID=UPI0020079401|nr:major facilitator superfamily domain-containing protein [Xylaria bambusicola]KAI0509173.1 major facilitator superfamily domain-containing protein [Xylaria bambusicola]